MPSLAAVHPCPKMHCNELHHPSLRFLGKDGEVNAKIHFTFKSQNSDWRRHVWGDMLDLWLSASARHFHRIHKSRCANIDVPDTGSQVAAGRGSVQPEAAVPRMGLPLMCPNWHPPQGRQEQLGVVVSSLKQLYGLRDVFCWHGLSLYWSGVSTQEPGVAKYKAQLVFSEVGTRARTCSSFPCAARSECRHTEEGAWTSFVAEIPISYMPLDDESKPWPVACWGRHQNKSHQMGSCYYGRGT